MNKAKVYPWIGVAIGVTAGMVVGLPLACVESHDPGYGLIILNSVMLGIVIGSILELIAKDIYFCSYFILFIFVGIETLDEAYNWGWGEVAATIFIGVLGFIFLSLPLWIALDKYVANKCKNCECIGTLLGACNGLICSLILINASEVGYYIEHFEYHPIFIILIFPAIGYGIGRIIERKAGKRLEYVEKINEYKTKIEQWKSEGYDVSELEEMLK